MSFSYCGRAYKCSESDMVTWVSKVVIDQNCIVSLMRTDRLFLPLLFDMILVNSRHIGAKENSRKRGFARY